MPMTHKTIEVIVPVQNMAELLDEALLPLLEQAANCDVVTVVNDASNDATESVARQLGANVITLEHSRGPYYARQLAAQRSEADVLLFVDARCRAMPGLLDAHRRLQSTSGVALSCTEVLTRSGPSLAARVAALRQGMTLRNLVDVPGRPAYFTTANLGVSRDAFATVGGFREMRSGADADICWRIQNSGLGSMAVDRRALMEWEPRSSMRDLASQWKRYGNSTAYLEWVYGDISPSNFDSSMSFRRRLWQRLSEMRRNSEATILETLASVFVSAVYSFGYLTAKRDSNEFMKPMPYSIDNSN